MVLATNSGIVMKHKNSSHPFVSSSKALYYVSNLWYNNILKIKRSFNYFSFWLQSTTNEMTNKIERPFNYPPKKKKKNPKMRGEEIMINSEKFCLMQYTVLRHIS